MSDTTHVLEHNGIRLTVDELEGMNVRSISFDGSELVICDDRRKAKGATYAIPVLFPTPNRVENSKYTFDGYEVEGIMHGFLRHERFEIDEKTEAFIRGHFDFDGENPLFPYRGRMSITITIGDSSVNWSFKLDNQDERKLSYSLALHPFFSKENLERVHVEVEKEMINNDQKIPTGETRDAETIDLATDDVNMDTVFVVKKPFAASMKYSTFTMNFSASSDFEHVVVYSSTDKPFLCIEPQTGSTDCHNLAEKGFEKEAGLIIVNPGESHSSSFTLAFDRNQNTLRSR